MIRSTIFWTHLVCGVVCGIVVFTMSLTGVLLTYERQINNWVAESHYVANPESASRLPLDQLLELQQLAQPLLYLLPMIPVLRLHSGLAAGAGSA
jgi:uncharacterized iron-regulated membrane protein